MHFVHLLELLGREQPDLLDVVVNRNHVLLVALLDASHAVLKRIEFGHEVNDLLGEGVRSSDHCVYAFWLQRVA